MLIFKELLYIELCLVIQTVFNLYLNQNRIYKQQNSALSPSQIAIRNIKIECRKNESQKANHLGNTPNKSFQQTYFSYYK